MKRRTRRDTETFSMSFLDCICCGFGAIILLLVLNEFGEPIQLEQSQADLEGQIVKMKAETFDIRGLAVVLERQLRERIEELTEEQRRLARLRGDLSTVEGRHKASTDEEEALEKLKSTLTDTRQSMIEESRELRQVSRQQVYEQPVAGVPIDSEYVIFVVDTSGSMQSQNWRYAEKKLGEVLNIYPKLKGIQVMDDEGGYMFTEYRGKWIPDSPARRKAILDRFRGWQAFSNSSPSEGIIAAIRTFWTRDRSISLYMIGDEFTGPSIQEVVDTVDRINRSGKTGERLVRIHALGFPIPGQYPQHTSMRYATLMQNPLRAQRRRVRRPPRGSGRSDETEQLMTTTTLRAALAASCLGLLAGCTTTSLETKAQLPPPLLEQLPVRVGIHYSEEFSKYIHKETRGSIDYEVNLGPAHVTNLDWLLKAMFRELVHVDDPTRVGAISPPLAFVLEPKFEEYSFLTPKDVAGEAFIVTIRYLLTIYDNSGARVDSFTFTGYGREKARTLASKEPLASRNPARDARRRRQGGRRAHRPGFSAPPVARRGQPAAGVAACAARGAAGAVPAAYRAGRERARAR